MIFILEVVGDSLAFRTVVFERRDEDGTSVSDILECESWPALKRATRRLWKERGGESKWKFDQEWQGALCDLIERLVKEKK